MRAGIPLKAAPVGLGALIALQSHANGALADGIGSPLLAGFASYSVGIIALVSWVALRGLSPVVAVLHMSARPKPWWFLGGLSGALFVVAAAAATPSVGVAAFSVAVIAGHLAGSLLVDHLGVSPYGRQPIQPLRTIATIIALAGVMLASAELPFSFAPLATAALVGVGMAVPFGAAANGRLRIAYDSAAVAALANLFVGFLGVALVVIFGPGLPGIDQLAGAPAWGYAGGVLGAGWLAGSAAIVNRVGVLSLFLGATSGQVLTSLLLDVTAPISDATLSHLRILGMALVVGAMVFASQASAYRTRSD